MATFLRSFSSPFSAVMPKKCMFYYLIKQWCNSMFVALVQSYFDMRNVHWEPRSLLESPKADVGFQENISEQKRCFKICQRWRLLFMLPCRVTTEFHTPNKIWDTWYLVSQWFSSCFHLWLKKEVLLVTGTLGHSTWGHSVFEEHIVKCQVLAASWLDRVR